MTVFIRVLESRQKSSLLKASLQKDPSNQSMRYEVDPSDFAAIPRSPFAYWISPGVREAFLSLRPLESDGRDVCSGATTNDDSRFLRLSFESRPRGSRPREDAGALSQSWPSLAKGGEHARFYSDLHLRVNWLDDGRQVKAHISEYRGSHGWGYQWTAALNGYDHFGRPGLTWSRRSQVGLSLRCMPRQSIFGDKGPTVFVPNDDFETLLSVLAVANSRPFRSLVSAQMAFGSFEVGVLERTPVPDLASDDESALAALAQRAWSNRRSLDTCTETSHAFVLPALLQVEGQALAARAREWFERVREADAELEYIQTEIDDRCFELYGISVADRNAITDGFNTAGTADDDSSIDAEDGAIEAAVLAAELVSWAVGVAFGRFDIRIATGERCRPCEPGAFDALPICSAAMLSGEDGLPLASPPVGYPIGLPADGVLIDDIGHTKDLYITVRRVFEVVFRDQADALLSEAASLLDPKKTDLRAWLARNFFEFHIKRYSKSRRKAPIIWQLATPSAGYSVWLYAHRADSDSLFRLRADVIDPKLAAEERKLATLIQDAGPAPTASQGKATAEQEMLVEELRAMRDEVARVAPIWKPDLDDGVIITMSPLWRLVPQHRAWQKELRATFEALVVGKYDWAHLAMHLWPERVLPKCATDRSLAIAHGLEDVFWVAGADGKWSARTIGQDAIDALIAERTSPAVADALKSLLEAPVASGGRGGTGRAGGTQ